MTGTSLKEAPNQKTKRKQNKVSSQDNPAALETLASCTKQLPIQSEILTLDEEEDKEEEEGNRKDSSENEGEIE